MNPVTSIDPAVFSARVNPQRQAEQAGPNRVDRKPDRVPSDPCEPPAFSEPGVRFSYANERGGFFNPGPGQGLPRCVSARAAV